MRTSSIVEVYREDLIAGEEPEWRRLGSETTEFNENDEVVHPPLFARQNVSLSQKLVNGLMYALDPRGDERGEFLHGQPNPIIQPVEGRIVAERNGESAH